MTRLKEIAGIIGASIVGGLMLLLGRKSAQLQRAKVDLARAKGKATDEKMGQEITSLEEKVKADDKDRLQKEDTLRNTLTALDDDASGKAS